MPAPKEIHRLVEQFDPHSGLNETQVRREFIDPFFKALGWDVDNKKGHAQAYKDVIHEDAIKVGGISKAPDYSFRIGGTRKFFVEAKKPAIDLKEDTKPAYQVRRYAWSAKLPLSILTDFEEFVVYDCRKRPILKDKASTGRIQYFKYTDYIEKWDEIAAIFSREAVLTGSFDKYVESNKGKRGADEVDNAFLKEIESWRENLAKNIAIRNTSLTNSEINFAVQRTVDRIIFLRICEDRGIDEYQCLLGLINGPNIYGRLCELYQKADARYNSGLFHFQNERGRAGYPDELTLKLQIDDKVLKSIIKGLYYPECPYEFSVLPASILGQVYEQFLGKVIHLTKGHHAKIEDKPEVKKAGGVYYTPEYIVDYIVNNTLGKLLEGKTPKQVEKIKVLDPACGSGSFLIVAYQKFIDWHLEHYVKSKQAKHKKLIYQGPDADWRLATSEKKRILTNNIFGVDIDSQAVEVSKLSLLLKVLENETSETINSQLKLFHERALPDLSDNIKCGNSLIGPDFYDGQQMSLLGDDEIKRINVFDWNAEFAEIMQAGGFDVVVGNPPYVRSINLKESEPLLWDLYRSCYRSASSREWDIYLIFAEKGLGLLNEKGKLGYILPNKFLNSKVGENLRSILSEGNHLERLVTFGASQLFTGATTYTCLLFLNSKGNDRASVARYVGPVNESGMSCPLPEAQPTSWRISEIAASKLKEAPWEFAAASDPLLQKIKQWPGLGSMAQVFKGTGTNADKVYSVKKRGEKGKLICIYSAEKDAEYLLEATYLKPVLRGRSIGRYDIVDKELFLIVPYEFVDGKNVLVHQGKLAEVAPRTFEYFHECKSRLDAREKGRFKGDGWYCYGRPQNMNRFEVSQKIVLPDVANRGVCYLDREGRWLLDTAYAIVLKPDVKLDLRYLLALLNSPLLTYFLKETGTALRGGYFRMKTAYLNPFPVRHITFSDSSDKAVHDKIVQLVEQMLAMHKRIAMAKTPHDKVTLQRQIDATDRQIDQLVYKLYGLTEEEIKIVEESSR